MLNFGKIPINMKKIIYTLFLFILGNSIYAQEICDSTITDPGGIAMDYENNMSVSWRYCADSGAVLQFDFTEIDLGGFLLDDYIRVYEGDSIPLDSSSFSYVIGDEAGIVSGVWIMNGDGSFSNTGNSFTSSGECVTFLFTSDTTGVGAGWVADITCLGGPLCSDGIQNGDETYIDCGGSCASCPTPCEGFTFMDAGGSGSLVVGSNQTYTMCADTDQDSVLVTFSMIDMGLDLLMVYDGDSTNVIAQYLVTDNSIYEYNGVNKYLLSPDSYIKSNGQCLIFSVFTTDSMQVGWEAEVTTTAEIECATVLPVELVSFNSNAVDQQIELTWSTEVELNNDYFSIYKSDDASSYYKIGEITTEAIGNVGTDYHFMDHNPLKGINYYQLRQTDLDGTMEVIGNTSVSIDGQPNELIIFPNPTSGNFIYLKNSTSEIEGHIMVYDRLGRLVVNQIFEQHNALNQKVDISHLNPGMYVIHSINGDRRQTSKFIKAK